MKTLSLLIAALIFIPALVWAGPKSESELSITLEPPRDAPTGQKHDGVRIGLWTEKSVYKGAEIRNVWMLTRKDSDSAITIGVGGSLFANSFLYITSNNKDVAKLPLRGGIDGMVNPASSAGGLSGRLAKLPSGTYQLTWKTDTHKSNTITIEIKKGEQNAAEQSASLPIVKIQ